MVILNFTMIPDVYCILASTAHTESDNKHATEICFVHMETASWIAPWWWIHCFEKA